MATGINVSKAVVYAVLSIPQGVASSKVAAYAVIRGGINYAAEISNYGSPTSTYKGTHRAAYSASIPSYPALVSTDTGKHGLPYTAAIPSYPAISSTSTASNIIPVPPPPGTNLVNLVVPMDLVDRGMTPDHFGGMGATEFLRSMFILDTNDYDGTVTYEHQIVARNTSSSPQTVKLRPYYAASISDIIIPANTTEWTLFTQSFTPLAGQNRYFWEVPDTSGVGYSECQVATGRVIVHQTNATKTLLWRPMSTYIEGVCDGFNKANGYSFDPGWVMGGVGTFRWTPALYQADLVTMVLECCVGSAYGDITTRCCLWDMTDDAEVAGTAFDINSGGAFSFPSAMVARNEFSTSLLTSNHIYSTKYQRIGSSGGLVTWWLSSAFYHRSSVYVRLYNISKCEVAWRVCKAYGSPVEEVHGSSRAHIVTGGGTFYLLYALNETDSIPNTYYSPVTQHDFWITNDGSLDHGDAVSATNVTGSNATQYTDATPYPLPIYSSNFKNNFVEGNMYCVRQDPVTTGSDANAEWTLVCLGFGPKPPGGENGIFIIPSGCSIC